MAEIVTPIVALPEGVPYTPGPDEYLIHPNHSQNDIARWIYNQDMSTDIIYYLTELERNASTR